MCRTLCHTSLLSTSSIVKMGCLFNWPVTVTDNLMTAPNYAAHLVGRVESCRDLGTGTGELALIQHHDRGVQNFVGNL